MKARANDDLRDVAAAGADDVPVEEQPRGQRADGAAHQGEQHASTNTEMTTGMAPKPSARNVAISRDRALTAEYIVLSAPNNAPTAMMPPTT